MIRKINSNKYGVIEYSIDTEEDLEALPRKETDNTVYAILNKNGKRLVYLYSKELKDYILINGDVNNYDDTKIKKELNNKANLSDLHEHSNKEILDGITIEKITSWNNKSNFDGNYNNLTNKPSIPTKTSQLTNDSGFLTSIPSEYITETELEAKGYLTEHQDISGLATKSELDSKVDKVTGKGLSTNDFTNTLKSNYDTAYTHSQTSHITTDNVNTAVASYVDEHKAELKGDKGDVGENGKDGITPTLSVGKVTTGNAGTNAAVTMTGNSPNYVLNFTIPKGDKGDNGSDANVNLNDYQTKTDNTLNTTNKTIVGAINEVKASIPTSLPANGGNADTVSGYTIWIVTQSEYDAISSKDSTTIYFIKG